MADDRRGLIDRQADDSPVYVQIAADLAARIERGEITRRVPSIISISDMYGVARATAHHALNALAAWDKAELVRGKGYYVAPAPPDAFPMSWPPDLARAS